jgi:hypothetical protein
VVVARLVGDQVAAVHRAAEPLEGIVETLQHLHVLDPRARADRRHGQRVELLVRSGREAGELDADVAQHAAVVVVVAAAVVLQRVLRTGPGALDVGRRAAVGDPVADDDHAAPVTRLPLPDRALRGEDDRPLRVPSAMIFAPRRMKSEEPGMS